MDLRTNALVPELSVADLAASLSFYVGVLGFRVAYERSEEGFAFLVMGEAQVMLDEIGRGRTWRTAELERPLGRGVNLQIVVERVEPLIEALGSAGIGLFLEVEERWYRREEVEVGNRQFAVQDPDGYLLRFVAALGERAAGPV